MVKTIVQITFAPDPAKQTFTHTKLHESKMCVGLSWDLVIANVKRPVNVLEQQNVQRVLATTDHTSVLPPTYQMKLCYGDGLLKH